MSRRAVLVTGAGGHLGRAVALRFAREGALVFLGWAHRRQAAERVAADVAGAGGEPCLLRGDLQEPDHAARMAAETRERAGRLDVLVHAAAAGVLGPLLTLTPRSWDWTLRVTARSLLVLVQAFAPLMAHGSAIIAVSSPGARRPLPGYGALGAAKAALEAMVRQLALELAPAGITVAAVSPGPMDSRIWALWPGADGQPPPTISAHAVAECIAWLASPAGRLATGQVVSAEGRP
jgi:enoyl-[acyl-carrier protein] reductase III